MNLVPLKGFQNLFQQHEIVSFDIFDTLLLRPFCKPTDVFKVLQRKHEVENFWKKRLDAEVLSAG